MKTNHLISYDCNIEDTYPHKILKAFVLIELIIITVICFVIRFERKPV